MKKYFVTGLVILLPVVITIAVVIFLVNLLTDPFMGMVSSLLENIHITEQANRYISKILILIMLFAVTLGIGVITRWFFIHSLLRLSDRILHKIPLVNKVYKTTQEIIKTILASDKNTFKQVVMAPFPTKDCFVIALVVRESPKACNAAAGEELISVLVPTTPNPTTGFLMMYKKSDLLYIDMKPEQAIKMIVSCGVVTPEHDNPEINK